MAKANAKKVAAPVVAQPLVVRFELLNETPGAYRYQEVGDNGTPLVNDADGAHIGGLYLRKAALMAGAFLGDEGDDAPKAVKITVEFE